MSDWDSFIDAIETLELYVGDDDAAATLTAEAPDLEVLASWCYRLHALLTDPGFEDWVIKLWPEDIPVA